MLGNDIKRSEVDSPSQCKAGSQRHRPRVRLLFRMIILGLILAGQEILFRALFPLPEIPWFNRARYQMMATSDPSFRTILQRGLAYDRLLLESVPDGFSEVHDLNLYGFRGNDFAIEPRPGRRRILLLGDSVTEGEGAANSATIAAELDRLFAAEGNSAEVINLGVIAADLPRLTSLARDAIGLLQPTDVMVILYANDLPAPAYPFPLNLPTLKPQRHTAHWWIPRVGELIARVARGQPIYRRWPHPAIRFFPAVPDPSNPWTGSGPPQGVDPDLYRAMVAGRMNPWLVLHSEVIPEMLAHDFTQSGSPVRYFERLAELCKSNDARFYVAYVPFCGVVSARYRPSLIKLGMDAPTAEALAIDPIYLRQNVHLAQLCKALGLPFGDTTEDLKNAEAAGVPQYWNFDTHPRPAGYATIARMLFRELHELKNHSIH